MQAFPPLKRAKRALEGGSICIGTADHADDDTWPSHGPLRMACSDAPTCQEETQEPQMPSRDQQKRIAALQRLKLLPESCWLACRVGDEAAQQEMLQVSLGACIIDVRCWCSVSDGVTCALIYYSVPQLGRHMLKGCQGGPALHCHSRVCHAPFGMRRIRCCPCRLPAY